MHNSFRLATQPIPSNSQLGGHDVGTIMSILQTVILSLILLWTPGMLLGAYLVMARPSHLENPVSHEPDQ